MSNLFDDISEFLSKTQVDDFNELKMDNLLTAMEIEALLLSLAEKRGEKGFTEAEAQQIIRWAEKTRVEQSLLDLTLKGFTYVNINSGGELVFGLTKAGKEAAEKD